MLFKFASFSLNENNFLLTQNSQRVEIEPKIFSLLCFFCKNPRRAISRDELIEKVWAGRIVSNAAINRAIGELRKIIEADLKKPQLIVTISKVGYQFNADIDVQPVVSIKNNIHRKKPLSKAAKKALPIALLLIPLIAILLLINFKQPLTNTKASFSIASASPLTVIKGNAFRPQVYKNGQMVFLHRSAANRNVQLWLQQANKSALKLTSDDYYYTYAVFKDAETIFASRFDNLTDRNCEIIELNIANKSIRKITECAKRALTQLAYNKSSKKLYFNHREQVSRPYTVKSIHLDTMRVQQLTHTNQDGNTRGDYVFALSPNNEKMAIFEYQPDGGALLKTIQLNQPRKEETFDSFQGVGSVSWVNKETLLISKQGGFSTYNLTTRELDDLIQEEDITQGNFAPNLSQLSYVKFSATKNIYQQAVGTPTKALTHSTHINFLPNYANISNAITYLSTDNGELQVHLLDEDGKTFKLHFPEEIKHFGNLTFAKDDSFILASINSKLFKYTVNQQEWQELQVNLKNIHYVDVIDNQYAIVSSDQSGDWQLWRVNLISLASDKLTEKGGYSAKYHAETDSIILSKYSQKGLFLFDVKNNIETKINEDFKITDWIKWQLRNDNVYFWRANSIISMNLNSKKEDIRWTFDKPKFSFFSVSHDESKLSYRITEQEKSSIWKRTLTIVE